MKSKTDCNYFMILCVNVKTATMTGFVFTHEKLCNKLYTMNLDATCSFYES